MADVEGEEGEGGECWREKWLVVLGCEESEEEASDRKEAICMYLLYLILAMGEGEG